MIVDEDVYLEHFGVKGMKWGVRNKSSGVSRQVNRMAKKDAEEFARAKAFYGQGAGTRRKLIKQTVEGKAKRIPGYQKAFDQHLEDQDTSKHAVKAVSERKRKDRTDTIKKSGGLLARNFTGEMGTKAAFTATAIAGATYLRSPQGQRMVKNAGRKVSSLSKDPKAQQAIKFAKDFINRR